MTYRVNNIRAIRRIDARDGGCIRAAASFRSPRRLGVIGCNPAPGAVPAGGRGRSAAATLSNRAMTVRLPAGRATNLHRDGLRRRSAGPLSVAGRRQLVGSLDGLTGVVECHWSAWKTGQSVSQAVSRPVSQSVVGTMRRGTGQSSVGPSGRQRRTAHCQELPITALTGSWLTAAADGLPSEWVDRRPCLI